MSSFGLDMKGVADSLLGPSSPFARGDMKLLRIVPGTGPEWNPGPSTPVEYPLSGALTGVQKRHIDGTLVVAGDQLAVVQVPQVEPLTSDKLVVGGKVFQIVKIERSDAADTTVVYRLFVRA